MQKINLYYVVRKILCGFFITAILNSCVDNKPVTATSNDLTSASFYQTSNGLITIDNAGIVPVLNNTPTTSIIYIHNNSNTTISGINYNVTQNSKLLPTISSAQLLDAKSTAQCSVIKARQACALQFTTPQFNNADTQGSMLITLNYEYNHRSLSFNQIINFKKIINLSNGVNFASGVSIGGFGNKVGYATIYLYGDSNNQTYKLNSIMSNKIPVAIVNKNIIGQNINPNQVYAVEIQAKIALRNFAATIQANSTNKQMHNDYSSSSTAVVYSFSSGGILTAGQIPVIDTAESSSPSGSLLITNVGNESVTLEASSATTGISNLSGCSSGSTLNVGQSCTITFNVTQNGGTGSITLNYQNYAVTGHITQVVNWYNSLNGALASMNYNTPLVFTQSAAESTVITVFNSGGYNLTNVTIPAPQILDSRTTTATISYPATNSCQNATLNVGGFCNYILTITDTAYESNQQLLIGVNGNYNNGTAQTYSRYGAVTYSAAPYTYLYVSNSNGSTVTGFLLDPSNGDLNQLATSPYSTGTGPGLSVMAPSNQFMYTTVDTDNISEFSINSTNGQLTKIASISTGVEPSDIVMTPNGNFLYITNWVSENLTAYSVNTTTGILSKISNYSTGGNSPQQILIDATGNYLYTYTTNNSVLEYRINQSNGSLSSIGSTTADNYPFGGVITPNNQFLYLINYRSQNVSAYSINQSTGVLTLINTYGSGAYPVNIATSPDGEYLYVLCSGNNTVYAYTIGATGELTLVPGSGFGTGGEYPFTLVMSSNGQFMYVLNNSSYDVTAFSVDESSGALTTIGIYSSGYAPEDAILDEINGYLYVVNVTSFNIATFAVNSTTGALTKVSTTPQSVGLNYPISLQILYVYPN